MTTHFDNIDDAVELLLKRIPGTLRIAAPLAIGKPCLNREAQRGWPRRAVFPVDAQLV